MYQLENSKTDVSVDFGRPYLCPTKGHKHGISIRSFINLDKTFFPISRISNIAQSWFLARPFAYLSSFISYILDFLYWMVCNFIFDCVTVKTEIRSRFCFVTERCVTRQKRLRGSWRLRFFKTQGMTGHSSTDTCNLQKQSLCWPNFWFCCFLIESKSVR